MKKLLEQKTVILFYVIFLVLGLATFASHFFPNSVLWTTIIFLTLVLLPGFSLTRIIDIRSNDWAQRISYWFGLGLAVNFLLCLIGLIFQLNIVSLSYLVVITALFLFILSFIITVIKPGENIKIDLLDIVKIENIPFIILSILVLFVFVSISLQGSLFKGGDTLYHLSLLRKIIENQPLTMSNLSYTGEIVRDLTGVAYRFPLWHIFVGFLTKISASDVFMFWRNLPPVLFLMSVFVWYWLSKLVLPTRNMAILATVLFIVFQYNWDSGYLFTTLAIPHSFGQLALLPLLVGLAIDYIFNKSINQSKEDTGFWDKYGNLIFVGIFSILIGCVHMTIYFYYLVIMIGYGVYYLLLNFQDSDYKKVLWRFFQVIISGIVLMLPIALILELKAKLITGSVTGFAKQSTVVDLTHDNFGSMGIFIKYGFLSLPIVFLVTKNYRKSGMVVAVFVTFLLMYSVLLSGIITSFLGPIFMKRLYANVILYWFSIAIVLGLITYFADKLISGLKSFWRYVVNALLFVSFLIIIWFGLKADLFSCIYNFITSDKINTWLNRDMSLLLIVMSLISIVIFIFALNSKIRQKQILTDKSEENYSFFFCLFLVLTVLTLTVPSHKALAKSFQSNSYKFLIHESKPSAEFVSINYIGGQETVDFIKNNIPVKSTFHSFGGYFYLATLLDVHMTDYYTKAKSEYNSLYDNSTSLDQKIEILKKIKPDYLLVSASKDKTLSVQALFDQNPEIFNKIFTSENGKSVIYQINKGTLYEIN